MTPLLKARSVELDDRLQPTDLNVEAGTLVALIGPNGSGKTSLLRALAAVQMTGGAMSIDGEDVASAQPARRAHLLAFLPASRDLVWPIRVREVIALGLTSADPDRVDRLLDLLELRPFADRPANQLSTGERARVLLARALAPSPRLLLLDEPLSNLDPYWVLKILELLRETVRATGCAAIVSLHDIDRVAAFDRVLLAERGRIIADRPPRKMLASNDLARSFRIERGAGGWKIRPEGPRSSP
ncbi:MAG: ABC transporter ATP-binding protein [Sphingomicrobium sp.]